MSRLFTFILGLSLIAAPQAFVRAQTAAYADIASVDTQGFPQISALVDVYNANGEVIAGLRPSDFTVYEDGGKREAEAITESTVPVKIVVAINPGPARAVRDANAVPRFNYGVDMLGRWADSQPADSGYDFSLVSLSGSLISH